MDQKFGLAAAGKLLGISGDAVRVRTKKNPDLYRWERDNKGKIWVWLDPEKLEAFGVRKAEPSDLQAEVFSVRTEARISALEASLSAAERARDVAESDRDHWRRLAEADRDQLRQMAETLAARPARRWWPF